LAVITAAIADVLNESSEEQRQRAAEEIERIRARLQKLTLAAAPDLLSRVNAATNPSRNLGS
jgi:hypothetical protein